MNKNVVPQSALPFPLLVPGAVAAAGTTTGTGVDRRGYEMLTMIFQLGAVTGTSVTIDVHLEESDASGSGYTDIPGAVFSTKTETSDNSITFGIINGRYLKRYIRAVMVVAGTSPVVAYNALVMLQDGYKTEGSGANIDALTEFDFSGTPPTA